MSEWVQLGQLIVYSCPFYDTVGEFTEDQETADRQNFQGRYILRHPWKGKASCDAARDYRKELARRQDREAQTLASLTGWDVNKIRGRMNLKASASGPAEDEPWWKAIWKD